MILFHGSLHPHNVGYGVDSVMYLVGSRVSTAGRGEVEIIFPYVLRLNFKYLNRAQ